MGKGEGMTDETRDALLLAVAEAIAFQDGTADDGARQYRVKKLLARCRHEIERPEDRG